MAKMTMVVASVAAASALALGGYWVGRARDRQPVAPSHSFDNAHKVDKVDKVDKANRDARLAGAIASLQGRLAELEAKQAATSPAEPVAAPPEAGAVQPEPYDPAREEEKRLERSAAIDAALETEPRDKSWAAPTETDLRAAVESAVREGAQFSVKALNCLTSICEMVLTASNPEDLKYVARQLATKVTGMNSLDVSPPATAPDGSATVTCRLFRQGYPRPDEAVL